MTKCILQNEPLNKSVNSDKASTGISVIRNGQIKLSETSNLFFDVYVFTPHVHIAGFSPVYGSSERKAILGCVFRLWVPYFTSVPVIPLFMEGRKMVILFNRLFLWYILVSSLFLHVVGAYQRVTGNNEPIRLFYLFDWYLSTLMGYHRRNVRISSRFPSASAR